MMRIESRISWIAAPLLALVVAGCCDKDKPLGVLESGGAGPAVVVLGTTSTFAVLAQDSVVSTGATVITGDIGVSPGTTVTGFPPATVSGTTQAGNATSATALVDLTTAINDVTARSTTVLTLPGSELSGMTLSPGLYDTASPLTLSGTVTLNALGNPDAVFIIRTAADLTTTAGSRVVLTGGAQAQNVIWLVGTTATLGSNSVFQGTILANQSITLLSGARLNGRAMSRTGAVTLDAAFIVVP
jgi:hypothetical protein